MRKANLFVCGMIFLALAFSACGSAPSSSTTTGASQSGGASSVSGRPEWVNAVDKVYSKAQYIAQQGTGSDIQTAERNALAALVGFFGQSIEVNQSLSTVYQEAVRNGIADWSENTTVKDNISRQASMDKLVGAEIKGTWSDRGMAYAVAVMEKASTIQIYTDMINANLDMINILTSMTPAEKNTLEGYSRYQFAAVLADMNGAHEGVLKVIGAPSPAGIKNGLDYRKERDAIVNAIPIGVTVTGDTTGRVQAAIAGVLSDMGFRSGGNSPRYRVEATLSIKEEPNPASQYIQVRSEIIVNLVDTVPSKTTLVPYSKSNREAHNNLASATQRALAKLETDIKEDYTKLLNEYLSRMLPKK